MLTNGASPGSGEGSSSVNTKWARAVALAGVLLVAGTGARALVSSAEIDQAVIATLASSDGIHANVIAHVDLTEPFHTTTQWTLVVAKQPDEESPDRDGVDRPKVAVWICFVERAEPDCSAEPLLEQFRERHVSFERGEKPFYELVANDVVYSGPGRTRPLLQIQTCTMRGANGSCGAATFLFTYNRQVNRFQVVFFTIVGTNNNQAIRFVESGPLRGDVIVAYPTSDAPFAYFVEVYERHADAAYARVLRYRGRTGYADGNRLAVIDSEMPETLRRLGLWKTGDAVPVPPTMPPGCTRLIMRKGVAWCEADEDTPPAPG
jgi:hypothetical protein